MPSERPVPIKPIEQSKDKKSEHLLDNLKLGECHHLGADPVRRYLKQILEEGDSPRHRDHQKKRLAFEVFKMTVPCVGHENVGKEQQNKGFYKSHVFTATVLGS